MGVVAVAVLLPPAGSAVVDETVALFSTEPVADGATRKTNWNVAVAPAASEGVCRQPEFGDRGLQPLT